jgi:hypothetical protein
MTMHGKTTMNTAMETTTTIMEMVTITTTNSMAD